MKWPNKSQWRHFFRILDKREKIIFSSLIVLFFCSFIFLIFDFYYKNTKTVPAYGGTYIEGVIGQPRFINPVYANSDPDRDLSQLVFSGLMKYDKDLNIVSDLAQNYEVSNDGTEYKFYLKENLLWQDNTPITADDVIFTIKTIQNADFKSPLRPDWVGVEVEKISNLGIKFKLKKSYNSFLENCTLKIIPQHIWQNTSAENFSLQLYNLEPIGSGPYKIKETKQEKSGKMKSIMMEINPLYFGQKPYISDIKFVFYNNDKELLDAAQRNEINGLAINSYKSPDRKWQAYYLALPRYFAVFLNSPKSEALQDKNVRQALNYATDKKGILKNVFGLDSDSPVLDRIIIDSPLLPSLYGFNKPEKTYEFNIETAKELLDDAGFADADSDGIREKSVDKKPAFQFKKNLSLNSNGSDVEELQKCLSKFPDVFPDAEVTGFFGEKTKEAVIKFQEKYADDILKPSNLEKGNGVVKQGTREKLNQVCFGSSNQTLKLQFQLYTVDQPKMVELAQQLKQNWKQTGIDVEIKNLGISELEQDYIKTRNYEMLLFGEVLGAVPDPLPFWHSSQVVDPGLNLAAYSNKNADKILEDLRKISDPNERTEKMADLGQIIISDAPAVFLYAPDYIYLVSGDIKNVSVQKISNPSGRFTDIESWFIKTRRVFK
jgi:ABC-type transport system substrate-binding protein